MLPDAFCIVRVFHIVFCLKGFREILLVFSHFFMSFYVLLHFSFHLSAKNVAQFAGIRRRGRRPSRCGRGIAISFAQMENVTTHQTENLSLCFSRAEKCNENPFVDMALNFVGLSLLLMKLLPSLLSGVNPFCGGSFTANPFAMRKRNI